MSINKEEKIFTKGVGAGGSNTNKNGLSYEDKTNITKHFTIFESCINEDKINYKIFDFDGNKRIQVHKKSLEKYLKNDFKKLEKSLQPDEAFIDIENKKIYILEKKFQQTSGSVDEKIQTGVFKKYFYEELYPSYEIRYTYVLNKWFKADKYKPDLRFLKKNNIDVIFGDDDDYFENIKKFILS